jgi:RHS repeat-associated protein
VEVSARRYRYTGKERDDETGLYYHGARYYAAWLARWTSADPLGLHAGLNLYLYGRASPVVYVDPSGMFDVMAMANLGQTVATNAAFSAADAEARSWAPDSSDSLYAEAARPSTEYDPNAAAAAMAEAPSRSEPTEFTEPGNMGFGTHLVSPGELYEQAQLDAENTWRQGVLERKDYTEKDLRGHKLWTQNPPDWRDGSGARQVPRVAGRYERGGGAARAGRRWEGSWSGTFVGQAWWCR